MPNLWTHILFGEEILKQIGREELLEKTDWQQLFQLGCQGPDFLLYHNFYPWKKDKSIAKFGEVMHTEECGLFLMEMIKHVRQHSADQELMVYVLGFLSHYVLDRHMHPYIYYKSGFKHGDHQRFEVIMDSIILKHLKGLETWKTKAWKQIYVGKNLPQNISDMLAKAANQVYPQMAGKIKLEDWNKAYQDIVNAHRIFHDPYGIKRVLTFNSIEPYTYKKKYLPLDYLNETKKMWCHPTNEEETCTDSFWDIWVAALQNGKNILQKTFELITEHKNNDEALLSALSEEIGNYSYDTGKPCNTKAELKYVQPII